jgi:hypothetical protein
MTMSTGNHDQDMDKVITSKGNKLESNNDKC